VTDLILGLPLAEADDEHAEDFVLGPEAVFLSRFEKEFLMSLWVKDFIVDLKDRSLVEKVKKLMPNGMGMEACPFTGFHLGQIDAALLVAHHHVDVAPWSFGMNGFLSVSRIGHGCKSWAVSGLWQGDDA
tara:strand:+ start:578 stop:967 length:390 start_codon:yes stop_codon:yes gene_type:complete